ncbi:MAG: GldG family protein, partial [Oscillospiraceae bacterium]
SVAAILVVVAIAVAVNLLVGKIPERYTKLDVSETKLYSLSQQTTDLVSGLDKQVELYLLAPGGQEDETLVGLLGRYAQLSDKLTVSYKDPIVNPEFAGQYTNEKIDANSLVVVCGDRSRYVSSREIYVTDYSSYMYTGQASTTFNGERAITGAIDYVTSERLPKLYTLEGHGEQALGSALQNTIASQNYVLEPLRLLSLEKVPDDSGCLVVMSPTSDVSDRERDQLLAYLKQGGSLLLFTDYTAKELPNLMAVMAEYGVGRADGVVLEGDANFCVQGYANYLLPTLADHEITAPLQEGKYAVLMPTAQGIVHLPTPRDTVQISDLLTSSPKSYAKKNISDTVTAQKAEGDVAGPMAVGVAVTEQTDAGMTHLVWFTTPQMLDDGVNRLVSGANQDLFLNSIAWMCERENAITIHPKSLDAARLTVPASATALWSPVLVLLLPAGVMALGVFVWFRRKRR